MTHRACSASNGLMSGIKAAQNWQVGKLVAKAAVPEVGSIGQQITEFAKSSLAWATMKPVLALPPSWSGIISGGLGISCNVGMLIYGFQHNSAAIQKAELLLHLLEGIGDDLLEGN